MGVRARVRGQGLEGLVRVKVRSRKAVWRMYTFMYIGIRLRVRVRVRVRARRVKAL